MEQVLVIMAVSIVMLVMRRLCLRQAKAVGEKIIFRYSYPYAIIGLCLIFLGGLFLSLAIWADLSFDSMNQRIGTGIGSGVVLLLGCLFLYWYWMLGVWTFEEYLICTNALGQKKKIYYKDIVDLDYRLDCLRIRTSDKSYYISMYYKNFAALLAILKRKGISIAKIPPERVTKMSTSVQYMPSSTEMARRLVWDCPYKLLNREMRDAIKRYALLSEKGEKEVEDIVGALYLLTGRIIAQRGGTKLERRTSNQICRWVKKVWQHVTPLAAEQLTAIAGLHKEVKLLTLLQKLAEQEPEGKRKEAMTRRFKIIDNCLYLEEIYLECARERVADFWNEFVQVSDSLDAMFEKNIQEKWDRAMDILSFMLARSLFLVDVYVERKDGINFVYLSCKMVNVVHLLQFYWSNMAPPSLNKKWKFFSFRKDRIGEDAATYENVTLKGEDLAVAVLTMEKEQAFSIQVKCASMSFWPKEIQDEIIQGLLVYHIGELYAMYYVFSVEYVRELGSGEKVALPYLKEYMQGVIASHGWARFETPYARMGNYHVEERGGGVREEAQEGETFILEIPEYLGTGSSAIEIAPSYGAQFCFFCFYKKDDWNDHTINDAYGELGGEEPDFLCVGIAESEKAYYADVVVYDLKAFKERIQKRLPKIRPWELRKLEKGMPLVCQNPREV